MPDRQQHATGRQEGMLLAMPLPSRLRARQQSGEASFMTPNENGPRGAAHLSGLLGFAALLIAVALPAGAETLKLGNEGIYPPLSIVSSDAKLSGIEPDWAREMCKRMNADYEFVVMDFRALINPLPERKAKALFSIPIVYNPETFIVPADSNYQFTKRG
jgi:ABC-type amino acid transport substrate-binding protein